MPARAFIRKCENVFVFSSRDKIRDRKFSPKR